MNASYTERRVLVLGAAGFIGRWVARELTRAGAELVLADRESAAAQEVLARWEIRGSFEDVDLAETGAGARLVERVRPAALFNLAGYGVDPREREEAAARRLNAELPEELARAMSGARDPDWSGRALVHVGTALEYGEATGDLREDGPTRPTTLYGQSKLAGVEALCRVARERGLPSVVARLFTVYGPGERAGRLMPTLLEARGSEDPIPLTAGAQLRDFAHVEDVAQGLLRLGATSGLAGEIVNLASGRLTSVREFIESAAAELGLAAGRLRFGEVPTRGWEMQHDPVNVGRLRALLGWTPSSDVAEGVRRTAAFG
jgi:nucleoside-diphosphate-sugar epimerase